MISVTEARRIISENLISFNIKEIDFMDSNGCIIAENILADRDFPPFDRVTMDGIAINRNAFENGIREFKIEDLQPAGSKKSTLSDINNAIEVMTGAILPGNTDTVIRYEDLEISETDGSKVAKVIPDTLEPFKNIHFQGEDRESGDLLISSGKRLSSPEIAVLATTGKNRLRVFDLPKTAVISTGDELVEIDQIPLEHQIRKSNIYAILNELRIMGAPTDLFHLADDKAILESKLKQILNEYPVVILSGGVSKGKLDFVPGILEKLGVRKKIHFVSQRPGKPLWFGASGKNIVFALPGNPVSTFMCFIVYVKSWFFQCMDVMQPEEFATLDSDASFTPNLTYFMQVRVYLDEDSILKATPVIGHGSGDLANLIEADGFMELPAGQTLFNSGTSFPVHVFRRNKVVPYLQS